ncbi:hypothetical protein HNR42_001950 [Deinobacterium chartae]|uniref:Uncharacterized protein n=1 Tax=Deinobacterium chartae TaxID=521158 RepID=A0A841I072_9DEIO|nr:hypothetical protein [Deinobacterium chartae]MBB6098516.1 hypothetical protein [Deinobacterium chartae]
MRRDVPLLSHPITLGEFDDPNVVSLRLEANELPQGDVEVLLSAFESGQRIGVQTEYGEWLFVVASVVNPEHPLFFYLISDHWPPDLHGQKQPHSPA